MNRPLLPTMPCLCSSVRRSSRALTQRYEQVLRPLGLRASQFTILQTLSFAGAVSQGRLGEILAMDSTTLTRTLAIMQRRGWIAERRGKDRRERWLLLAKSGETQLKRALPAWNRVQSRLRLQLGERTWKSLMRLTNQITELASAKGESL